MPRIPPGTKRVEVYLPPALAQRVESLLRSDTLGRVPHGSWNAFLIQRINEFFGSSRLPLGQYGGFAPDEWVMGPPRAVRAIAEALEPLRVVPDGQDEIFPELNPLGHVAEITNQE
jgi:hypothetical protein